MAVSHYLACFSVVTAVTWVTLTCCQWARCVVTGVTSVFIAAAFTTQIYREIRRRLLNEQLKPAGKLCVLVTGCDSGFGHEVAKSLQEKGYHVFAGCLFPEGGGAKELTALGLDVIGLDVTNQESVDRAHQHVMDTMGKDQVLWCVVNNAGVAFWSPTEWQPVEQMEKMLDVNLVGVWRVTRVFLPLLRKSAGRVVNVVSLGGRFSYPPIASYCASKFGVVALSDTLNMELRQFGIRVITVEPTYYKTAIADDTSVQNQISQFFDKSPEDIKAAYGSRAVDHYRDMVKNLFYNLKRDNVQEVVDSLLDAVCSQKPKRRYVVTGLLVNAVMPVIMCLPIEWSQFIAQLLASDLGILGTIWKHFIMRW